ncbi:MAG: nickel pincer cofactor biosynthesis protein LarC [Desulfobacterales bacterium]|nr:nickel pincer cofactor biosynthesis protein LarC [Desulfobacterales bacterium]
MIAYFDIFSGISGDMTLGALVDLGVPVDWLESQIKTILFSEFKIKSETIQKNGLSAQNLFVKSFSKDHSRDYQQIKKLILESNFSKRVKEYSFTAFEKIAKAEAKIHSQDIENVHFHEVGAVDAIVDIVGSFLCIEYLNIKKVYASKISLGSGFIECSHGILPVPAPATLAILKDVPIRPHDANYELVTPTGAAIITTLTSDYGKIPEMILKDVGYGAGKRTSSSKIPNLLRIITGKKDFDENNDNFKNNESVYVLETTTDDMSQEYSGYIFQELFKIGALDVCHIPVQMKKNRPGTRLEILCKKEDLNKIIDFVFKESTTTGIRYYKADRIKLKREIITIKTKFGKMLAKKITNLDKSISVQPEYEELKKIAKKYKIPLKKVYQQVNLDINSLKL